MSWKQIHGVNQTSSQLSACNPLLYVYYDASTNQRVANSSFPSDGMISPCGLWAWSFFNDTYSFRVRGANIPVDVRVVAMFHRVFSLSPSTGKQPGVVMAA